ncbi:MAG: hypothetical protein AAF515_00635 [Pseudomonadota bacterium]
MTANDSPPSALTAVAPGKLVLCGEYAVLVGAPALVMAVDRCVRAELTPRDTESQTWRFDAIGFAGSSTHPAEELADPSTFNDSDPARLWAHALATVGQDPSMAHACLLDTSAMYAKSGRKLGLGSSAASTVACCGLLAARSGRQLTFDLAKAAHSASQGGVGSGLDIAASMHGGLIRFASGHTEPRAWPNNLYYRFIDTGVAASTPPLVRRFDAWRQGGIPAPLQALIDAATTLADEALNLDNLARYAAALEAMDRSAGIGIYSAEHRDCQSAAEACGVVYKPCGAGGGDLGIAISDGPDQLDRFARGIAKNYATIELGIAQHGLIVR